ncbi:MAG: SdrD B-like domain-containing protein, partial [Candidatus Acetothermia bacterium]
LEPFRFIGPTKGQVKGYLYLDRGKGDQRTGEGVEGALLVLDDKEAITGEDGQFTFPPVEPGSYLVQIKELEAGLSPQVEFPLTVDVEAGDQIELDVPLRPRSWLRGTVFNDQNENGVRDLGESLLSGVELLVTGEETSRSVRTGANGRFTVDLPPGTYKVELQEDTLPERGEPTTPSVLEIQTEEYGRTEVEFGVYQKPRPVEVTFGPPTAAFSFSPEEPLVGEEVRFDGSDSSAIRVDIERYQWTLSHEDREIQREGGEITVELDQPGTWEVTLTVVDENGLKNTRVKAFEVREG